MENKPQHGPRIGTFFLLIGFFSFVLFLLSGFSQHPAFSFFFVGLVTFLIGFQLRRGVERRPSSGRFRIIQQLRERQRQQKEADKDEDDEE